MRYVIMANGKGRRWANYGGIPKHLIQVEGETLLARTSRLLHTFDENAKVIITSSNPACVAQGALRHVPEQNSYELDRYCYELIEDGICFLYGDVFYTWDAICSIVNTYTEGVTFYGNKYSIVAVKVQDSCMMKQGIDALKEQIKAGAIEDAKGWHLYHYLRGMELEGRATDETFIFISDITRDFNYPDDWETFKRSYL